MGSRKDVYGMLFSPLVALGGLGCVGTPVQSPAHSPDLQVQARQTPATGPTNSAEIGQAGARGSQNEPVAKLHSLYREAAERYTKVGSYIVSVTRRAQISGGYRE